MINNARICNLKFQRLHVIDDTRNKIINLYKSFVSSIACKLSLILTLIMQERGETYLFRPLLLYRKKPGLMQRTRIK